MSLAPSTTFAPGDLLKAADLNGIQTNILTHPIDLISPSTGAINFNLQAHTGLLPSAISATSGSNGQVLMSTGGLVPTYQTIITTGALPSNGSTGTILAVTSSNSTPAWQVIPIDGGLSTTVPTAGMMYYVSTSAALLKGLTAGSSGQVLTMTTSGTPGWAALPTGSTGSLFDPGAAIQIYEDFFGVLTTQAATATYSFLGAYPWIMGSSGASVAVATTEYGVLNLIAAGGGESPYLSGPGLASNPTLYTSHKPIFGTRFKCNSTAGTFTIAVSLTDTVTTTAGTPALGSGIHFWSTSGTNVWGIVKNGTAESSFDMGVTSTAYHHYKAVMLTSSSVQFFTDGVSVGTVTTTNVPSSFACFLSAGCFTNDAATRGVNLDYLYFASTRA